MIRSFTIINDRNETLTIDITKPYDTGLIVESVEGLGPVTAEVNMTPISTGDGSNFNSSRMSERNIVFQFQLTETIFGESIEDVRLKLYRMFRVKKAVTVVVETDARSVAAEGIVESNEPNIFSPEEMVNISILCPDPMFYGVRPEDVHHIDFTNVVGGFTFPFSNESLTDPLIEFGVISSSEEVVFDYPGSIETGMQIIIDAVTNATGKLHLYKYDDVSEFVIDLTTISIASSTGLIADDRLIVNTIPGSKGVALIRNGVSYNILSSVERASTWFKIHPGENTFGYELTGSGATGTLAIAIESSTVYEGV